MFRISMARILKAPVTFLRIRYALRAPMQDEVDDNIRLVVLRGFLGGAGPDIAVDEGLSGVLLFAQEIRDQGPVPLEL
jgi:hypothetical protein